MELNHCCDGSAGAVVTDFDGDGRLELLVSHGESAAQPISVYKVNPVSCLQSNIRHSAGSSYTHTPLSARVLGHE